MIRGNTITTNTAVGSAGGGVCCVDSASPTITGNTITGNTAQTGGGIYCTDAVSPAIMGNTITGNNASVGGGVYCSDCSADIAGNSVTGNTAALGGGIACDSGSPTISDDLIMTNSASGLGGGIECNSPSMTIVNDVVADNSSAGDGGGIWSEYASVSIVNDTIVGNSAGSGGGGVLDDGGLLPISNCIVWSNSPDDLGNCAATYSDITVAEAGAGNIHADPAFVASATGDYHLTAGSPCIDKGTAVGAPSTDKDGISRPWGFGYDMGAYEYNHGTYHTTTKLSGPSSVKVKKSLKLTGTVSPTEASPYAAPGKVTITITRKVGKKWKKYSAPKVSVVGGKFSYSFKPKYKGSWRFVATYGGGSVGMTPYLPSTSAVKGVKVK